MIIEINWNPDSRQLRSFGLTAATAACILACYLRFAKGLAIPWCIAIVLAGLGIAISSVLAPAISRQVYRVMVALTMPIGLAISLLLMTLFYALLITPLAMVFRLVGRDTMSRRFDPDADTYWVQRKVEIQEERYFQQF
ncbi:MAG: SxtJ family membrane protein [Sedimentisphaerales bacterium]|jgi:hypothetical protein|nr:SxtJ family membrane protein [Sedimentisphaerales bacterium]